MAPLLYYRQFAVACVHNLTETPKRTHTIKFIVLGLRFSKYLAKIHLIWYSVIFAMTYKRMYTNFHHL